MASGLNKQDCTAYTCIFVYMHDIPYAIYIHIMYMSDFASAKSFTFFNLYFRKKKIDFYIVFSLYSLLYTHTNIFIFFFKNNFFLYIMLDILFLY